MTAPTRFIVLIIVVIAAAAAFMAPRTDEWLAVMLDEDKQAQIISLLEPRLAHAMDDPGILAILGRAYAETGNYTRAIELLERYTALRPHDAEAYWRLADLYKRIGDLEKAISMLEPSIAIAPQLLRVVELAGLYRQNQQSDKELALLSQHETELTVESGALLHLAELRNGVGDRKGAIRGLMRPEVLTTPAPPTRNAEARLFLAKLLIESGRSVEATRLGKQWILDWHEPWLAGRLLRIAALRAPAPDASELADAVAASHPEIRFYLVHELATMGARPIARHLLETWVKANPSPSMNEIAAFLTACREQDEPGIVWHAFGEVLARSSPDEIIARYSEAIAAEFGIGAMAPFWTSLPPTVIERRPLLAARLAFYEHDLSLTRSLLEHADLARIETSDRRMWLDLLDAVASPPEVFVVLRDRRRGGALPADLLAHYARLAGELGQETEYQAALAALRRKVD
jgi:tetratricopeptide (TPR) repeat protein